MPEPSAAARRSVIVLLVTAVLLPILLYGLYVGMPAMGELPPAVDVGTAHETSAIQFRRQTVGNSFEGHPRICHVQVTQIDPDGPMGVLICDAANNSVSFATSTGDEEWEERVLLTDVIAPAHATVTDMDADGDFDILVSMLGNIEPDDGVIGRLVLLERTDSEYRPRVILNDVRRVADAQPADFDGDGDIDIAVAVFGYNRGQVLWLENLGNGHFRDHELLSAPGTIHVPIADYDGDGDPDIAAIVTQDEEELWGFENLGDGRFDKKKLWFTHNYDLGSAGLLADDLDRDGDVDLILPAGDNLEDFDPFPQPYHGCLWFENTGAWNFQSRRLANFGGTYAAATDDLDHDGDTDVVLVSMANVWDDPARASMIWLENDGSQNFAPWKVDSAPTHLVTVATGDINDDGHTDIVAGGLHIRGPYDRLGRVTAWIQPGAQNP